MLTDAARSTHDDHLAVSSRRVSRAPRHVVYAEPGRERERTTVSQTLIRRDPSPPRLSYAPPARESRSTTIIQHAPPPRPISPPKSYTPPRRSRVEVVSVQQEARASKGSVARSSVAKRDRSSRGHDIEKEIVRERVIDRGERLDDRPEYDSYRYVEPPARKSKSIIESQPRVSGRVVERERVLVEDGGRRREYFRRG